MELEVTPRSQFLRSHFSVRPEPEHEVGARDRQSWACEVVLQSPGEPEAVLQAESEGSGGLESTGCWEAFLM